MVLDRTKPPTALVFATFALSSSLALAACSSDDPVPTGTRQGDLDASSADAVGASDGAVRISCASFSGKWTLSKVECGAAKADVTAAHAATGVTSVALDIKVKDAVSDTCTVVRETKSASCTDVEEGDLYRSADIYASIQPFLTTSCAPQGCSVASGVTCIEGSSLTGALAQANQVNANTLTVTYESTGGDCAKLKLGEGPTFLTFTRK